MAFSSTVEVHFLRADLTRAECIAGRLWQVNGCNG